MAINDHVNAGDLVVCVACKGIPDPAQTVEEREYLLRREPVYVINDNELGVVLDWVKFGSNREGKLFNVLVHSRKKLVSCWVLNIDIMVWN